MAEGKTLMVFDFDHTIVNANSSIEMQKIHPVPFTSEMRKLYITGHNYMGVIYSLLHERGFTAADFKKKILNISLITGMKELFEHLRKDNYEVIIVSDANTLFIDWLLTKYNMRQQVAHIYSNPAEFDDEGRLVMKHYHEQDWCDISSPSMCKGNQIYIRAELVLIILRVARC